MVNMKPSGVQWIGDIPSEWKLGKVKNRFYSTKTIVGDKVDDYERLALTLGGVIKRSKEANDGLQPEKFNGYQILKENELVFKLIDLANVATSRVGLSPYTGIVSPAYIVLHDKQEGCPRYAEYYFLSMWMNEVFNHLGGDGVRSSLNTNELLNIPFPLISDKEQTSIADYLDDRCSKLDEIITEAEKSIEEYKELKQAVIFEAVTKGLDKNVPMKDSGVEWIGKIPQKWSVKKIKYTTQISRGLFNHRPRNAPFLYDGPYPFIQTGDVARANHYITEYRQTLSEQGKKVSKYFPEGTLTMTIAANVGDVSILTFGAYFPDSVLGFIPYADYSGEYLYYIFAAMKTEFMRIAISNTQLNLNIERVKETCIPVIESKREQQEIVDFLDVKTSQIDALISEKQALIEELRAYKKSLIYEVVTGKRRVGLFVNRG